MLQVSCLRKTEDLEEEVLKVKIWLLNNIVENFKSKAMAVNFPTFDSWEHCVQAYNKLKEETGFEDNVHNTTVPTGFNNVKDLAPCL